MSPNAHIGEDFLRKTAVSAEVERGIGIALYLVADEGAVEMESAYDDVSGLQGDMHAARTVLILSRHAGEDIPDDLDVGVCDALIIDSFSRAYSQIKRARPDLIVMCVSIDEPEGFQALSLLQLDEAVAGIPMVLCEAVRDAEITAEPGDAAESRFLTGHVARPCWN